MSSDLVRRMKALADLHRLEGKSDAADLCDETVAALSAPAPAPAEPVAWPMTEEEARSAFWGCYPHSGDGDKSEVWMTAYRWCRLKITKTYRAAPAAPAAAPAPAEAVTWECKLGGLKPLTDAQYQKQPANIQRHYTRIAPAAPAGWQLVPKNPTPEMVEAITECINMVDYRKGARAGWQSALAAAPGAPQGDAS